ncbi:MAG TPA: hypothetical protein VFR22_07875, partial [Nocardioidaceae bacterium]|nr:hypothetical protein [Nocardioidaceae bacterium]
SGAPVTWRGATSSGVSTGAWPSRSTTAISRRPGPSTARCGPIAVAAAGGSRLLRQREALRSLGIRGTRPDLESARDDPVGYVRALSDAGAAAELTASPGLGDFGWIVTTVGVPEPW